MRSSLTLVYLSRFFLLFLLVFSAQTATARPRVGLVLGGGGARGAAHIGVLQFLEEQRIPVDCIAGTSMGALVAGTWVAGRSPNNMRKKLEEVDWDDIFQDSPSYAEMGVRHREVTRSFFRGSELGVDEKGLHYPSGMVTGQKIKLFFNDLVKDNHGELFIEDAPIPLLIVATDIGTGEKVVFRHGDVASAMRASMSVPGLLAPYDYQGRKLVDGGLVDNLPIAEVKNHCAVDVVIAVNVASPLLPVEEIASLFDVSAQTLGILTQQNVERSIGLLDARDIYIKPDLERLKSTDFQRSSEAADRGYIAIAVQKDALQKFVVPEKEYALWQSQFVRRAEKTGAIDGVEVFGLKNVNPAVVKRHVRLSKDDGLKANVLDRDVQRIYGDGHYELVDYNVFRQQDKNVLRVFPIEKSWGPHYFHSAINLQADSNQGSDFSLRGAYRRTWLNDRGGELLLGLGVGNKNQAHLEFYQPLDETQRFFLKTSLSDVQDRINIYEDGDRVGEYRQSESALKIGVGMNVGLLGSVDVMWQKAERKFRLDTGSTLLPEFRSNIDGWTATLDFDQMDSPYFPKRGWSSKISYFEPLGRNYSKLMAELRVAHPVGKTVFNARGAITSSVRGELPFFDAGTLGGFQNMTALAPWQIIGNDVQYLGLRIERIIADLPLGLRGDMRAGVMLEGAKTARRYTETRQKGSLFSTSIYAGGNTPLGPVYLGAGYSKGYGGNIFLFIGTP